MSNKAPTWIVAVSGGIDSAVLLDILLQHSAARLIVAHVDHGIRLDSHLDKKMVASWAQKHGLQFESVRFELGANASEASAREARYRWLNKMRLRYSADSVVTAHHQDDVLETIIINYLRGTGWRGLTSLRTQPERLRPLIHMSKARIVAYAIAHHLEWRDDSTNNDPRYLRNAIRMMHIPRLSTEQRHQLIRLYENQLEVMQKIEHEAERILQFARTEQGLQRYWLIMTSDEVAGELIQTLLHTRLQAMHIRHILHFVRAASPGAQLSLPEGMKATVTTDELIVYPRKT